MTAAQGVLDQIAAIKPKVIGLTSITPLFEANRWLAAIVLRRDGVRLGDDGVRIGRAPSVRVVPASDKGIRVSCSGRAAERQIHVLCRLDAGGDADIFDRASRRGSFYEVTFRLRPRVLVNEHRQYMC